MLALDAYTHTLTHHTVKSFENDSGLPIFSFMFQVTRTETMFR